jgi:hypothetical protein
MSHKGPFTSVNSEAKLGYFMSLDTFPVCINELKSLNDPKFINLIEILKAAIEIQESRSRMDNRSTHREIFPAFRLINFSSKPQPPRDPASNSRLIIFNFTQKDSHTEQQKK